MCLLMTVNVSHYNIHLILGNTGVVVFTSFTLILAGAGYKQGWTEEYF